MELASKLPICPHCLAKGTVIAAAPYPKPIEEININDYVLGTDGQPHLVTDIFSHQTTELITLDVRGVLPITCTPEHKFLVLPRLYPSHGLSGWKNRINQAPRTEHPTWKSAEEIMPDDYLLLPLRTDMSQGSVPEKWNDVDRAWFLGLFAGDGCVSKRKMLKGIRHYHGSLFLAPSDDLSRVLKVLDGLGLKPHITPRNNMIQVTFSSVELATELADLLGLLAPNKHLPAFLWADDRLLGAAIEGLLSADGSVGFCKGIPYGRIFSTSKAMIWQVWYALFRLNKRPIIRTFNRTSGYLEGNVHDAWTVEWRLTEPIKQHVGVTEDYYAFLVKKTSRIDVNERVYDITLEGGTMLSGGVVSHNCGGYHVYQTCPRIVRIAYDHVPNDNGLPVTVVSALEFDQKISRELWSDVKWIE